MNKKKFKRNKDKNNVTAREYRFGEYVFRITELISPQVTTSDYNGNKIEIYNLTGELVETVSDIVGRKSKMDNKEIYFQIIPYLKGMYDWRSYEENCIQVNGYLAVYLINFKTLKCVDKWLNR